MRKTRKTMNWIGAGLFALGSLIPQCQAQDLEVTVSNDTELQSALDIPTSSTRRVTIFAEPTTYTIPIIRLNHRDVIGVGDSPIKGRTIDENNNLNEPNYTAPTFTSTFALEPDSKLRNVIVRKDFGSSMDGICLMGNTQEPNIRDIEVNGNYVIASGGKNIYSDIYYDGRNQSLIWGGKQKI